MTARKTQGSLSDGPRWLRAVSAVVFLMWILGGVSFLALPRYQPSQAWLQSSEPHVTLLSSLAAVLCCYLVNINLRHQDRVSGKPGNRAARAALLIFGLFLFQYPIADLMRRGVPAVVALAAGERVEHAFIIDRADGGGKGCRRQVELRDMPFTTRLCAIPEAMRRQLVPGRPVVFIGTGTWMGLFVEDLRKPWRRPSNPRSPDLQSFGLHRCDQSDRMIRTNTGDGSCSRSTTRPRPAPLRPISR